MRIPLLRRTTSRSRKISRSSRSADFLPPMGLPSSSRPVSREVKMPPVRLKVFRPA